MNKEFKLEYIFYAIAVVLFIALVYVMAVRIEKDGVNSLFHRTDIIVKTPVDGKFQLGGQDAEIIDISAVGGDCDKILKINKGFSQTAICVMYSPEFYEKVADSNSGLSTSQKLAFDTSIMGAVL